MSSGRLLILFWILLSLACAENKTVAQVMPESAQKPADAADNACAAESQSRIATRFMVDWEDGTFSIEEAENVDLFIRDFLKPNLQAIHHAEFDKIIQLNTPETVTTESVPETWGQNVTQASGVWAQGIYGQGVTVAIVDTPVDYSHVDLKPQVVPGWDFVSNTRQAVTPHRHATHIAGIIAGRSGGRVAGLAPQAKVMGVSFMDASGSGSMGGAILAMNYAADNGVKIINNSWGGSYCSESMREAMKTLAKRDVLLVVAAGNDGLDIERYPTYPASFNVATQINVAASTISDILATFSNNGWKSVHLAAPGKDIFSSVPGGYEYMDGTSMAAPFVSGAAALLKSVKPEATAIQIKQALINSVDAGPFRVLSSGRLDINRAVDEIRRLVP